MYNLVVKTISISTYSPPPQLQATTNLLFTSGFTLTSVGLPLSGLTLCDWNHVNFVSVFFHLASCFQSSSMLQHRAVLHFFSCPKNIPLWIYHILLAHSLDDGCFVFFPLSGYHEFTAVSMHVQFLCRGLFSVLGYIPRNEIWVMWQLCV